MPQNLTGLEADTALRSPFYLPAEIWRLVFRYATNNADILPRHFLDSYDPLEPNTLPPPHESRRTKQSISMVCEQWREIVTEFLFESITLRLGWRGRGYEMPQGNLARHFRFVRRLTVKEGAVKTLPILRACPNLVAYTQCDGTLGVNLLKSILEACASSLRYLQVPKIDHPEEIFPLLSASAPQLEWLEFDSTSASSQKIVVALPSLHTLRIWSSLPTTLFWDTPRLQSFTHSLSRKFLGTYPPALVPPCRRAVRVVQVVGNPGPSIVALLKDLSKAGVMASELLPFVLKASLDRGIEFVGPSRVIVGFRSPQFDAQREPCQELARIFEILVNLAKLPSFTNIHLFVSCGYTVAQDDAFWRLWLCALRKRGAVLEAFLQHGSDNLLAVLGEEGVERDLRDESVPHRD